MSNIFRILPKLKRDFLFDTDSGMLDYEVKGENGFGYDVIFIPNGYKDTFGIIDSEIKNKISHRAQAIQQLVRYFENDFNN